MEANLDDVESLVHSVLDECSQADGIWASAKLCSILGQRLDEMNQGPGILRSAFRRDIPVFIPAFTDSEIGLDVAIWAMLKTFRAERREATSLKPEELYSAVPGFNPFLDLQQYARLVTTTEELGIFTIGGGVPRNWAQQVVPYSDTTNQRFGTGMPTARFRYGVRICPEPVHWGGLSGSTYSEGTSWGKFVSPEDGGRYAEVFADATVVLPLLMRAVFEQLDRLPVPKTQHKPPDSNWQ